MTQQAAQTAQDTKPQVRRQQKEGVVISNKMDKTIVVAVVRLKRHRIYKRTYKQTKHFYAHDAENSCQIGDQVRIEETRPLSKLKRWRLIEIVKRGSGVVPVNELLAEVDPDLTSAESESEADEDAEVAEDAEEA